MSGAQRRVLIRLDATRAIGTGHLARCMALARALEERGAQVVFALAAPSDWALERLGAREHLALELEGPGEQADARATALALGGREPFDVLIVDHYGLGRDYERALRSSIPRVAAIDDLPREHDAELLLDTGFGAEARYVGRIPAGCERLFGPRFALLDPALREARAARAPRAGRVLLTLGGADPSGATLRLLEAYEASPGLTLEVIVGAFNPDREVLEQRFAEVPGIELASDVRDMPRRYARAALCLGAGGVSALERCCVGLPSLLVCLADNQRAFAEGLARAGAARHLGDFEALDPRDVWRGVAALAQDRAGLEQLERRGRALVDGEGAARVAARLLAME